MNYLVSIITPSYNCEQYIAQTIDSAIAQTYFNWEMLIVDDCSTDGTVDIIRSYSTRDGRIKLFENDKNLGAAETRNVAIRAAKGCFIAFLDSDDLWFPDKLKKQLTFMETNNVYFSCSDYEKIDEHGESLKKVVRSRQKSDYNRVLLDCPVGNSTVMYNSKHLGKFTVPNIRKRNDDALWLKILKTTDYIYGINEILVQYRVRQDSLSSSKLTLVKYHWYLYRKIENLSIIRSCFHLIAWAVIKFLKIK